LSQAVSRRLVEKEQAEAKAKDMKLSPLDRAVAGLEAVAMAGSAMFESVQQLPQLLKGEDAYSEAINRRTFTPRYQPEKAKEYVGNALDAMDTLQTEYKVPPIMPELAGFQPLAEAAKRQAMQGVKRGALQAGRTVGTELARGMYGDEGLLAKAIPESMKPLNVIKEKAGNWRTSNLTGGLEKSLESLKTKQWDMSPESIAAKQKLIDSTRKMLGSNIPAETEQSLAEMERQIQEAGKSSAINNWIERNAGNYIRKDMGTPTDPVRLMLDKRAGEIEAQFQTDMNRAGRTRAKAEVETDPDKQATLMQRADQQEAQAQSDRDFSMQHATHLPPEQGWENFDPESLRALKEQRKKEGFDPEGMAKSAPAQRWEGMSDEAIDIKRAGNIQAQKQLMIDAQNADRALAEKNAEISQKFDQWLESKGTTLTESQKEAVRIKTPYQDKAALMQDTEYEAIRDNANNALSKVRLADWSAGDQNPFISKLDPEAKIYSANIYNLGLDHVVDVIKQDVAAGRIRPEQLSKLSMDQAIQRTAEYNRELAEKMNSTRAAAREGLPVYKEYPEGYRWIELNKPGAFHAESEAMGHSVKGYEPPQGHPDWVEGSGEYGSPNYGYGGWEGIKSGKAKVYSLVNHKGEPHVTVEVGHADPKQAALEAMPKEVQDEFHRRFDDWVGNIDYRPSPEEITQYTKYLFDDLNVPMSREINQIKGKGNARPIEKYDPYTQDFVKSGNWERVGDLQNTGLHKLGSEYLTLPEAETKFKPKVEEALNFLDTHPALEQHRIAHKAAEDFRGDVPSFEYEKVQSAAGKPITRGVPYTVRELKALLTSPEDWVDRGETIYTPISTALDRVNDAKRELGIADLPPIEGMKAGGAVSISDNPDTMMMELEDQKFAVGGAAIRRVLGITDHAERAAKATELLVRMKTSGQVDADAQRALLKAQSGARSLPTVLPRAAPKAKDEIRAYAQRTADQLNAAQQGQFLRANPTGKSENAAGKSKAQWQMEQGLTHNLQPLGLPLDPIKTANIEDQLNMLKMGISGDTSVSDQMLHQAGQYALQSPSEQQGGSMFGLRKRFDPAAWASNVPVLENLQRDVGEFSKAYGDVPVIGQYNSMGSQGTNFAQHFADANLEAIANHGLTPDQAEQVNKVIKKGNAKSGAHADFPGVEDPAGAYLYFSFFPELRKHFNDIMTKPDYTTKLGLPDGRVILHAITDPELRDMPVLTSGRAQYQLVPGQDPKTLPLSEHSTYTHNLPREPDAPVTQTPFPVPAELEFSDVTEYAKPRYKPSEMTRVMQTASPRQIVDPQHIDEIKQYEDFMRQYTPQSEKKKAGGLIKVKQKAGGGIIRKAIQATGKAAEAAAPITRRLEMNFKDVAKPVPELTEGAQKLKAGQLSREEYEALVSKHKPVTPYSFVPQPASPEDATRALNTTQRTKFGKVEDIPAGTPAGLRLDINAYKNHGVWVNSIHPKDMPTTYNNVSSVTDAEMIMPEEKALEVATREKDKSPFAVIKGGWNPITEEQAVAKAQEYLNHPEWAQVGIDPERHGYYYNRATMEPIIKADEVIQIGPLVLAKNPVTAPKESFKYARGGEINANDLILTERPL
jgi:hypothetical protein